MNIVKAFYDTDVLTRHGTRPYLQESTQVIARVLAGVDLPNRRRCYHKLLRLVLCADGPRYFCNVDSEIFGHRGIGYFFYDETFASAFIAEALIHRGRFRPIVDALIRRCCTAGTHLWGLLPTKRVSLV